MTGVNLTFQPVSRPKGTVTDEDARNTTRHERLTVKRILPIETSVRRRSIRFVAGKRQTVTSVPEFLARKGRKDAVGTRLRDTISAIRGRTVVPTAFTRAPPSMKTTVRSEGKTGRTTKRKRVARLPQGDCAERTTETHYRRHGTDEGGRKREGCYTPRTVPNEGRSSFSWNIRDNTLENKLIVFAIKYLTISKVNCIEY